MKKIARHHAPAKRPGRPLGVGLLLLILLAFGSPAGPAEARLTMSELFILLPDSECGGYSQDERRLMLSEAVTAPRDMGRSVKPDPQRPWVDVPADNLLILHRPAYGDISYKSFDGNDFQLIAACRDRQRVSPLDTSCLLNLCLLRHDGGSTVYRVELKDYLPRISILDFVAADTMKDPNAVRDIARRAPDYAQCLTTKASAHERLVLDVITSTTINASACADFLPPFGLLPLTWNGSVFTKPYDRADPPPGR